MPSKAPQPSPGLTPEQLRKLLAGQEPSSLPKFIMQPQVNVRYHRGTAAIDLAQFPLGYARGLVRERDLPDFHIFLTLDEYVVSALRNQIGWSFTSAQTAAWLIDMYPVDVLISELAALNRVRRRPDMTEALRQHFMAQFSPDVARRLNNLTASNADSREFLARQPILLAMRDVLLRNNQQPANPPIASTVAAIMLTHALASDLNVQSGTEDIWPGLPADIFMEVVANGAFNSSEDLFSRLDRTMRIYFDHGDRAARPATRRPFGELAAEALGMDIPKVITLGVMLINATGGWAGNQPLWGNLAPPEVSRRERATFLRYVAANHSQLRRQLSRHHGPWGLLPFEKAPVLRHRDRFLVLDQEYLERRITTSMLWPIADHESHLGGGRASRAWLTAYGQAVESATREQLAAIARPVPIVGGAKADQTYFVDGQLLKAYPAKKGEPQRQTDAAIWLADAHVWLTIEVVQHELKVPTRQGRQLGAFKDDFEKMVAKKLRQLDRTAKDLLSDNGAALLNYAPGAVWIQPILIQGGFFPVQPPTIAYINAQVQAEGLFERDGAWDHRIRPLAMLHVEEIEQLEAAIEQDRSLIQLLNAWQNSERSAYPLKNYLYSRGILQRPSRLGEARCRALLGRLVAASGWVRPTIG